MLVIHLKFKFFDNHSTFFIDANIKELHCFAFDLLFVMMNNLLIFVIGIFVEIIVRKYSCKERKSLILFFPNQCTTLFSPDMWLSHLEVVDPESCGKVDFENINYLELSPRWCYVFFLYNKINVKVISRFSRNTASLKLQERLGDDYSEDDEDYEYRDVDPSKVGDFNSEHRLVGGKVEKWANIVFW